MDNFIIDDGLDQEEEVRTYVWLVFFFKLYTKQLHVRLHGQCLCACDDTVVYVR